MIIELSSNVSNIFCHSILQKTKYAIVGVKGKTIIMGEISLRWKGIEFAEQQLNIGLQKFSDINAGDFDVICDTDSDEQQISDNNSIYDVNDEYIEQLTEEHGQDKIETWNDDLEILDKEHTLRTEM